MRAAGDKSEAALTAWEALTAAFALCRPQLVSLLTRRLGSSANAEDLAQDTIERALRTAGETSVVHPRAFLFQVAKNLAHNHAAQERRRAELREEMGDIPWSAVDEVTPERRLATKQDLARMRIALSALPARTQQILAWRRFDGATNKEIAARLGISTTAVEKHLRKGLAALTRALAEDEVQERG